jgi:hypothetical protein
MGQTPAHRIPPCALLNGEGWSEATRVLADAIS